MNKFLSLVLASTLVLAACDNKTTTEEPSANDKPVIKIGVMLPLSGDVSKVGQANKKAIEMALEDAKKQNLKYNYQLIFENDMLQPKQAAIIANKFINIDKVNAIISMWGIVAPVVADIAQKNQILNITCAGLAEVSKPFYSFNNYTQDTEIIKTLIKQLKKENVKTIAFVTENNAVGNARATLISQELKKVGIEVVATELYNPGEKDFKVSITKLEKSKPDYYVMFIMMPGTKLFTEQFFQLTGKRNLAAIDVFHKMPKEYYSIVNGLWYVKSANGTPDFLKDFQTRTKQDVQSCVGNSYENLKLLIWAYENVTLQNKNIIPTNEDVAKKLYSIKHKKGAIGEYSIDEKGIIQSKATIEMMVDGKPVVVAQ